MPFECAACGEMNAYKWNSKYKAWLCEDHFNHHNTEDMIFSRIMIGVNHMPEEETQRQNALSVAMAFITSNDKIAEAFISDTENNEDMGYALCKLTDTVLKYIATGVVPTTDAP